MSLLMSDTRITSTNDNDHINQCLVRYDRSWEATLSKINTMVSNGLSINEMMATMRNCENEWDGLIPKFISSQLERLGGCDFGEFGKYGKPYQIVVNNGRYHVISVPQSYDVLYDLIERCLDSEVDAVVEFGSGWGRNLAALRLRQPTRSELTYIACEPSSHGRQATELLFSGDRDIKIKALPFDYTSASLEFLSDYKKIVAFTSHSVEQVTILGDQFYRSLLDTSIIACIHMEPIGWQRYTNLVSEADALNMDRTELLSFLMNYNFVINDAQLVTNSAAWAIGAKYNIDLLNVVSEASRKGLLNIYALGYDLIGRNPFNPSSILAWRR